MKIKYLAVLVATLVHYILGGLWYSPLLFGNKFLQFINWPPDKVTEMGNQSHVKELLIAFVMSLVMVYILAHFVQYTKATTAMGGIQTAFWLWLGFVVTTQAATVIFEQRHLGLYLLNVSYQLVGISLAAVIMAKWRSPEAKEA